jgi:hypothetical protein
MSMMAAARGCGTRQKGGVYACTDLGPNGRPVEYFLVDPPVRVDLADLGVSAVGVKPIEFPGPPRLTHIVDVVGSLYYPNTADFVEEVRHLGMSRRLPGSFPFSQLSWGSLHVLIHERACIVDFAAMYAALGGSRHPCPQPDRNPAHDDGHPAEMCAGLWWEDIEGETEGLLQIEGPTLNVVSSMPSFSYHGRRLRVPVDHAHGIFMRMPIHRLAVINDPEDGTHEKPLERAMQADLPVGLEDS